MSLAERAAWAANNPCGCESCIEHRAIVAELKAENASEPERDADPEGDDRDVPTRTRERTL